MARPDKKSVLLLLVCTALIAYLLINTGFVSDDFDSMARLRGKNFWRVLTFKENFSVSEAPIGYFTHQIWYCFFRVHDTPISNALKIFYILVSFYLISRFFSIYVAPKKAYLISFLFIFFPSHDATVYWFMGQYFTVLFALYLYAFYLAHNNKLLPAFFLAVLASFIAYGSTPLAIALFLLFALNKEYKKGTIILVPNILFMGYYFILTKILRVVTDKTLMAGEFNLFSIIKQFMLQILTFADAVLGPSMWLKVYYSFSQMRPISLVIGMVFIVIFYKKFREDKSRIDPNLLKCFATLAFLSFAMFAVTGHYPQLTFNLGNRVTIFGALIFVYILVILPLSHKFRTLVFAMIIFTTLGVSDHWKNWSIHQQKIVSNIKNNAGLRNYRDEKIIYVSGNQYSKYGPISHIEFLSEGATTVSVFHLALKKDIFAHPLSKRHVYKDGYLVDTKYKNIKDKVDDYIPVYDSENDLFFKLKVADINSYIETLPPANRHWIQMVNIKFVKDLAKRLMPRLKYAF
ncbi:MAG: glucosyltransferase domain-containing protein [Omnitrophica bacterium]|nr:glucosyltransferase domain-containing protein [Candidatus Omnitrophota bacterium]